jgi:hypothetical protein
VGAILTMRSLIPKELSSAKVSSIQLTDLKKIRCMRLFANQDGWSLMYRGPRPKGTDVVERDLRQPPLGPFAPLNSQRCASLVQRSGRKRVERPSRRIVANALDGNASGRAGSVETESLKVLGQTAAQSFQICLFQSPEARRTAHADPLSSGRATPFAWREH